VDDATVSVGEVLALFKEYGVTLLAGEAGLDHRVSGVSVLELGVEQQNPAWYLGGELALSTLQMYPSVESVIEVVRLLSSRKVAALGIHQGTAPSVPDARIVDAAESLDFPLFSIPCSMPYSIIFTGVYERIFSKRITNIRKEEKMRGDLYGDLLSGAVKSEEYVSVRAARLDIPLQGRHCVLEVIPDGESAYRTESARARFGSRLQFAIRRVFGQYVLKSAVLPQPEGYLVVLHFSPKSKPSAIESQIRDIYKAIREQLSGQPAGNAPVVGVGEAQESLMLLAQSCRQANRAIALGRKINENGGLFFFGKMGIYSLVDAKSMEEFHANCLQELARFTELCGANARIYLDTLEAYFDFGESPSAVAGALGLHLNTVRYRMKKIGEILGADFFRDGKEKMRMYLLIKMQKII
jgi:sugar diacid utilization regulator